MISHLEYIPKYAFVKKISIDHVGFFGIKTKQKKFLGRKEVTKGVC